MENILSKLKNRKVKNIQFNQLKTDKNNVSTIPNNSSTESNIEKNILSETIRDNKDISNIMQHSNNEMQGAPLPQENKNIDDEIFTTTEAEQKTNEDDNKEDKTTLTTAEPKPNRYKKNGKFTAKAINYGASTGMGAIAGESPRNFSADEEDLNDLSELWAEYYEITGKEIDPKTMLWISNAAIYAPRLMDAIYIRYEKMQAKKQNKTAIKPKPITTVQQPISQQSQIIKEPIKKEKNTNTKDTQPKEQPKKKGRPKTTPDKKIILTTPPPEAIEPVFFNDVLIPYTTRPQLTNLSDDQLNGRRCLTCYTPLKSKQVYFCSAKHQRHFNTHYERKF